MNHMRLIQMLYKHREIISQAYNGEVIDNLPTELVKDIPIFQKVAKRYELNESYIEFANTMLKRVSANYRFGDYNEEIKLLIDQKDIYQETKDRMILGRIKDLVRTLYKKIEQRDMLINARINDIVNDNDLSMDLIIKDAIDIDARITELISAHTDNLKVLGSELRNIDDGLDELLIEIGLDLLPLTENIHRYNDKLSNFILRTEKRKRENKQLMSIANKIIKEQDSELKSLLLSNHQIYFGTIKEKSSNIIKSYPTQFELKKYSFLELLTSVLSIERVEKKANPNKPYREPKKTILKAVNIKKIESDIAINKPKNIYEYILSHSEIQKFKSENLDKIFSFKVYLTIVQNYRKNIKLLNNFEKNIKVAKWI